MRSFTLIAAAAVLGLAAVSAPSFAATKHKAHHPAPRCADRVLCGKLDSISARLGTVQNGVTDLTATVKSGQAAELDYQTKQLAYSDQMLTSLKAIEAQGGQSHSAVLLTFTDHKLAEGEKAADVATQTCLDSGFKGGKPVEVVTKSGWSRSGTYLNSVVCTF
ncbi:MAG TPA: hypothetical protein VG839_05090 [Asticcacaulis sp.]|nr:hypothetical protein [Asticcacaulis sp.]